MSTGKATFNVPYLKTLSYEELEAMYGSNKAMFEKVLKLSKVKKPRKLPNKKSKSDKE